MLMKRREGGKLQALSAAALDNFQQMPFYIYEENESQNFQFHARRDFLR